MASIPNSRLIYACHDLSVSAHTLWSRRQAGKPQPQSATTSANGFTENRKEESECLTRFLLAGTEIGLRQREQKGMGWDT